MPICQECEVYAWMIGGDITESELETHYCPYCYDTERQDYND